jgi:hypothetical protein
MYPEHILQQLRLPDRYETLFQQLGPQVAHILVPPEQDTLDPLERAAYAIQTRNEGLLVPLYGESGVGKTTLLDNLTHFLPGYYTQTLNYQGSITFEELIEEATSFTYDYAANEQRILPINIDHRENAPPTDTELAEVKRFLRTANLPVRVAVFWPDTSRTNVDKLTARYVQITGDSPIPLPLTVAGPPREAWVNIAKDTLQLANDIESLENLGVDPSNYDPAGFITLGSFLRRISTDFDNRRFDLQKETREPLYLVIVFPSESQEPGILTQLTSSSNYGLLDPHALVGVTPNSEVGRWWSTRRGLLTRAIVQLNAHTLFLSPGVSVGILRKYGPDNVQDKLREANVRVPSIPRLVRDLSRSDFGKHLTGVEVHAYESRGTPAQSSVAAYQEVAKLGLIQGKDKLLNRATGSALNDCLPKLGIEVRRVDVEKKLDFCGLIPDNAVYLSTGVLCLEYHWRAGDYLTGRNRSGTAQYILK